MNLEFLPISGKRNYPDLRVPDDYLQKFIKYSLVLPPSNSVIIIMRNQLVSHYDKASDMTICSHFSK